jgi:hypothetical protein
MIYLYEAYIKTQTLQIIKYIESNDGRNIAHNSTAFGSYGIKPSTAKELGYNITKKNEGLVASSFYDEISKKLNTSDPNIIVYAWLKGIYGAKKQINKPLLYRPINQHWHVKKYRKYLSYYDKILIDMNSLFTR